MHLAVQLVTHCQCSTSHRLIALMLGRLRLTVDEAISQYGLFAQHVFSEKKWKGQDGTFKARKLEETVKRIVKSYGIEKSADERMMDSRPEEQVCKRYCNALLPSSY